MRNAPRSRGSRASVCRMSLAEGGPLALTSIKPGLVLLMRQHSMLGRGGRLIRAPHLGQGCSPHHGRRPFVLLCRDGLQTVWATLLESNALLPALFHVPSAVKTGHADWVARTTFIDTRFFCLLDVGFVRPIAVECGDLSLPSLRNRINLPSRLCAEAHSALVEFNA